MTHLIEQHQQQIVELCRRYGIKRLEMFGSGAREDFDPSTSDVDFIYEFDDEHAGELWDRYWGFIESAESLLGRKIDMVYLPRVNNHYVRESINRDRVVLYAA